MANAGLAVGVDAIVSVANAGSSKITPEGLGRFSILRGVSLTERAELLHRGRLRQLGGGELLIRQGEPNHRMYLLLEGALDVHLDDMEGEPIATIPEGETVGEISILDGELASASVLTRGDCQVLEVDESAFWSLIQGSHAFAVQLLGILGERLRANNHAVRHNAEQRAHYERAALFDALTGIHNRRWLDEGLPRMVERHRRDGKPLSVALIDIDHFKKFNDDHGHDVGDHVLSEVAASLMHHVRPTDLVARYGGEEFVVIFPGTPLNLATVAGNRLREAIAREAMVGSDGNELPGVTISVGISELEGEPEEALEHSVAQLLKVADVALYRSKEAGRNKVSKARRRDLS